MTKTTPGRMTTAESEMIQDILDTPIDDIKEELREEGLDPAQLVASLQKRLAIAQEEVIQRRIEAAQSMTAVQKITKRPVELLQKTIDGALSIEGLTMAARNGTRPMGLSDPSVEEDLADLDSDDWDDD